MTTNINMTVNNANGYSDFKKRVLSDNFPTIYTNTKMPDPKHLGVYLMTKVIPVMDERNEYAFGWFWAREDVGVYSKEEYTTETNMYKTTHKMKCAPGDTTWYYDYKVGDKKRRCIMTTEIWYKPRANHNVSPIAILFAQFMGAGLHIVKCKFEDVE